MLFVAMPVSREQVEDTRAYAMLYLRVLGPSATQLQDRYNLFADHRSRRFDVIVRQIYEIVRNPFQPEYHPGQLTRVRYEVSED